MTRRGIAALMCAMTLIAATAVRAETLSLGADDDITAVLTGQMGNRITVRTESGEELTGKVAAVNGRAVHLAELAGREYFDAVIAIDNVEAVIVRVK